MIALLQRVSQAGVAVEAQTIANIGLGLLVLIGIQPDDGELQAQRMVERIMGYRVFEDAAGKMNRSLLDVKGELLLVPQFTLAADTRQGMRPGFSTAASKWFERVLALSNKHGLRVEAGQFGADMQVALVNEGPVTFWLEAH
jgi:D-aminoacyl-tRNA deacylase